MLPKAILRIACAFAAVLVVVFSMATPARGQAPMARIQGRVTNAQTGEPINAVQIVIEGTTLGNLTNEQGYYLIEVPAGLHSVRAQSIGYRAIVISEQRLLAGQTLTLNFRLQQTAVELEALLVSGDVSVYRSWRSPNLTVVDGLFRVDGEMLGTGEDCRYSVELVVRDTTGAARIREDWQGNCLVRGGGEARSALETFRFELPPAQYTIEVTVRPEGSQRAVYKSVTIESFTEADIVSDLILGDETGQIEAGRESNWSIRKGRIGIRAAAEIVADRWDPNIGYYVEVYASPGFPVTGKLVGVIRQPDGQEIRRLLLQEFIDVRESHPLAGNFSVAGLVYGEYQLEARLELADRVITRTHRFYMAPAVRSIAPATERDSYSFQFRARNDAWLTKSESY
jgi:hypothetical protein